MAAHDSGATLAIEPVAVPRDANTKDTLTAHQRRDPETRLGELVSSISHLPVGTVEQKQLIAQAVREAGVALMSSAKFERARVSGNLACRESAHDQFNALLPDEQCPDCGERCSRVRTHWQTPIRQEPHRIDIANVPAYECADCGIGFPWEIVVQLFVHAAALAALMNEQESDIVLARRAVAHLSAFDQA